jgi:hypothetical protein
MTPYRDDVEQLRARLDAVIEELADLRARTTGYEALLQRGQQLESEAALLARQLEERRRRPLPLLEHVKIASPCNASWDSMEGDETRRFCGQCQKHVYNLSALPRQEAERLLGETEARPCVRLYRRADGTVLTADCPVGQRRARRRLVALTALALGGAVATALAFYTSVSTTTGTVASTPAPAEQELEVMMGDRVPPDAPAVSGTATAPLPVRDHEVVMGQF